MKNHVRFAVSVTILLLLYTLCYFMIPYAYKDFLIYILNYVFACVGFLMQGYTYYATFAKKEALKSRLYGYPIFVIGITYGIISTIVSIVFAILNAYVMVPLWVLIIVYCAMIGITALGCISVEATKEVIVQQEKRTETKTETIDNFKADIKSFAQNFDYEPLKAKVNKLKELVIYSDPVSNDKTKEIENKIEEKYHNLKAAYSVKEYQNLEAGIDELVALINERNTLCKAGK